MLAKKLRLKNEKEITLVFKNGRCIHGKYFLIKYLPNNKRHFRLAVSVSNKLFKKAVDRNKIKRLIKFFFQIHFNNSSPLDILVITKKTLSKDTEEKEVRSDFEKMITKLL